MDLIYSVSRKRTNISPKVMPNSECLEGIAVCSISSQNIVAFTTTTELEDLTGKTWGSHVYVTDLNIPWNSHKVFSSKSLISALEWDLPGDKLLIADTAGNVQIWSFRDHVLNDWVCLGTASFPGENILRAVFFHNGKKVNIVAEKKDSSNYNDKFTHLRFAPSVQTFGACPLEGCLVITSTSMVGVVVISSEGQRSVQLVTTTGSLAATRHHITAVDICYGKNGHFLVAASSGNSNQPIQCYRVTVQMSGDRCTIIPNHLPSFYLQSNPGKDSQFTRVTQLKFVVREDADSVVVASSSDSGSIVEVWELREWPVPMLKFFAQKQSQAETYKSVSWQHQSQFVTSSPVVCIATSKTSMTTLPPLLNIMVALADGTIHCLLRDSLKLIASTSLSLSIRFDEPVPKHRKTPSQISCMDISWLGCVLVVADTQGQLYLYRVTEPGGPITVSHACTMLEYCLKTGIDWWDLLISIRPSLIDAVCERFTENFNRQGQPVIQFHYVQFLNIKTSLYRLTVAGQSKAADLTSLLMLHSVATAFKSLLRPSDTTAHDKGPAESLQSVMSDSVPVTDVDKVLLHLEAKEFTVEPSALQSLQPLIQWIADLALNLLARLPEQRQSTNKSSGYEILHDYKALKTLRELLVIIRIWGLLRPSCLPVFIRSAENLDVLALIFKLLSRLVQSTETDEAFIDDCCLLPNQVMIPQLNPSTRSIAVASPSLYQQNLPISLEYNVEPDSLLYVPEVNSVEGMMQTEQTIDSIRHIYLGKNPLVVKQCSRCGAKAHSMIMTRTAAVRAWDMRWVRRCLCGGRWRVHKTA